MVGFPVGRPDGVHNTGRNLQNGRLGQALFLGKERDKERVPVMVGYTSSQG